MQFGHLERMKKSSLSIKYQKFVAYGSLAGEKPWKSWKEVIRQYLEEQEVIWEMAKNRNA